MLRLGLVGHPVSHSLSPPLHRAAIALKGLRGSYELFDVPNASGLEPCLARLRRGELAGLNVTVPHKLAAFAACDRLDPLARRAEAVNTLVSDGEGGIAGWNTDLPGLVAAIRTRWGDTATASAALIIGAGGAARAAVLAADALGASEIRVWNRTPERARALVERLGVGAAWAELGVAARGAGLVIQSSSWGMDLSGDALTAAVRAARDVLSPTRPSARVVDLVYRPSPTAFVRAAREIGREAMGGLPMLIHQAALSFELFSGARREVEPGSRAEPSLVDAMTASVSNSNY